MPASMIVMGKGSAVKVPIHTMRLIDMDVERESHQNIVLALCKTWHHNDVWVRLKHTMPPDHGLPDMFLAMTEIGMEIERKRSDENWSLYGLLAVDKTITTKNPGGIDKVVGFSLYIINKQNKNQLQVLFLFVNKHFRNCGHATNMMKTVQDRHLGTAKSGEKFTGHTQSVLGYDLVNFIMIEVLEGAAEIAFYKTLGFAIASEVAGWDQKVGVPTSPEYIIMVDAGPKTWDAVMHKGLVRLEMQLFDVSEGNVSK